MNIIETEINDIPSNLVENKKKLVNNIINHIQPLFDKEYIKNIREVKKINESIKIKKEQVKQEKEELEKIRLLLDKKTKEQTLLGRINKLVISGLIQESMKNELIILIKNFEGMDSERINSYLNETMKILSQRFAKV